MRRPDRVASRTSGWRARSGRRSGRCSCTRRPREARWPLPFTFSTFDYRELCALLWEQRRARPVRDGDGDGADGATIVHTDRGDVSAPLVVDALGWRRVLGVGANVQPPNARLSRGLEVHPGGPGADLELWIDRDVIRAGYGWSFPAGDEVRVGVGSFDPHDHVKDPTVRLATDWGATPVRYQGNWIPHRLRPAAEDGVFFAGDTAGHCLPLTAEGIRTALYFGDRLRARAARGARGASDRGRALRALRRVLGRAPWKFEAMLLAQRAVPRLHPRALGGARARVRRRRLVALGLRPLPRDRAAGVRAAGAAARRRARARRRLTRVGPARPFRWAPFGPSRRRRPPLPRCRSRARAGAAPRH